MRFSRRPYPEYVHKVHYSLGGRTLCSAWKTCGKKKPQLTIDKNLVTCKTCIKKLAKGGYILNHFEEELFTL